MTVEIVVPDVMGDVRTWLRSLTELSTNLATAGSVFFSTPEGAATPLIRLTETGLAAQEGETPTWMQRLFIEVIGGKRGDYAKVSAAKNTVCSAIWALTGPIGSQTRVLNGSIDTVTDQPDPATGAPRKVISAALLVIHS